MGEGAVGFGTCNDAVGAPAGACGAEAGLGVGEVKMTGRGSTRRELCRCERSRFVLRLGHRETDYGVAFAATSACAPLEIKASPDKRGFDDGRIDGRPRGANSWKYHMETNAGF